MEHFFVEGLFVSAKGLKKAHKKGEIVVGDIEPFAKGFWANSPDEALQMASEALKGGQWIEGPKISKRSEEQHMRSIGAPELPGFRTVAKRKR